MRTFKTNLLAGASALLMAASFAAPASAVQVYGGGSSLIGPYEAQAFGCHVTTIGTPPGTVELWLATSPPSVAPAACPPADIDAHPDVSNDFAYFIASSGAGIQSFLQTTLTPVNASAPAVAPAFASSDSPLTAAGTAGNDIDLYNNGGTSTRGGYPVTALLPTRLKLIQIPLSIDPVALPTNAQFHSTGDGLNHPFNIHTSDGKIHLSAAAYCGIFNQTITDWNNPTLTGLNQSTGNPVNGVSLTGTFGAAPITLVGRSDSSGTSQILTRHLQAACGTGPTNHYTIVGGNTTLPTSVTFDLKSGSFAVATEVNSVPGAIGYVGADYVSPGSTGSGATPGFTLISAEAFNHNDGLLYGPTSADSITAFGSAAPPANTLAARGNQVNWVPTTSIADPAHGWPFVGTTQGIFYQKYDTTTVSALVAPRSGLHTPQGFLTWYEQQTQSDGVLTNAGLAPLPANWKSAIDDTFITNAAGLGLQIHN